MKTKRAVLTAFFLIAVNVLWAQKTGTGIIYDTIVPEARFTYSVGASMSMGGSWSGGDNISYKYIDELYRGDAKYNFTNPGIFYQAEWENFVLGINPTFYMANMRVFINDPKFNTDHQYENGEFNLGQSFPSLDLQFLGKIPLVKKDYTISILGGGGATISNLVSFNALAGLDIGFRLTSHHFLFLNYYQNIPIINSRGRFMKFTGLTNFKDKHDEVVYHNADFQTGFPFIMQWSVGIRTTVYQDIYYYKNQEVGRARKRL